MYSIKGDLVLEIVWFTIKNKRTISTCCGLQYFQC